MKKCLTIALLLLHYTLQAGTNYYVAPSGANTNNGLSTGTAFQTITYAATIATHGDTINVLAGTYTNAGYGTWDIWKTEQTIRINNKNGTTGEYLVIRPYQNDAVKIKGDGDYIIQIRNSSYIRVQGLEVVGEVDNIPLDSALKYQFVYRQCTNANCTSYIDTFRVPFGTPPAVIETMTFPVLNNILQPTTINNIGVLVQLSDHIDIVGNNIHHNTGTGLRVFRSDYINVRGNVIHNNSRRSSVGNHGLVFHSSESIDNNNGYKIFIAGNHVHHNYNEVYSWSSEKTFITPHIDEGKGISLQKNTVDNGWIHGKIKIENNMVHHNGFSGIHINEGIRVDIVNNTAFHNSYSYAGQGNQFGISVQEGDSIGIYNNIAVSETLDYALSSNSSTHTEAANNLVYGNIDADIDAVDVNTLFGNPMFVDTLAFKLTSGSPAIGNALATYAPVADYSGLARDAAPDIGAVEFSPTSLQAQVLDFVLDRVATNFVQLSWKVSGDDAHTSYFMLQRSGDAIAWQSLARIPARGDGHYSFADDHPLRGRNCYRLVLAGNNGTQSYSKTITANVYQEQMTAYPNPTTGKVFIPLAAAGPVRVFASDGKDVSSQAITDTNRYPASVDLSSLPDGLYLLKVNDAVVRVQKSQTIEK